MNAQTVGLRVDPYAAGTAATGVGAAVLMLAGAVLPWTSGVSALFVQEQSGAKAAAAICALLIAALHAYAVPASSRRLGAGLALALSGVAALGALGWIALGRTGVDEGFLGTVHFSPGPGIYLGLVGAVLSAVAAAVQMTDVLRYVPGASAVGRRGGQSANWAAPSSASRADATSSGARRDGSRVPPSVPRGV